MPADVVDLLSSSPTAAGFDNKSVDKANNTARDDAAKGKGTLRREEIDELPSSWPTSSDTGGLVITRNLDLGGERSPKRRKLQEVRTTTSSKLKRTTSLPKVAHRKSAQSTAQMDVTSDSDPFASSPVDVQTRVAPAEKSPSPDIRLGAVATAGLEKRTSPPKANLELDSFSSSFPEIDVLPNRVAVSASQAPNPGTRSIRGPAAILSSPTYPAVDDILAKPPRSTVPLPNRVERGPVTSLNPFSSSPLPDITTRMPLKEGTLPEVCRISSSPEPALQPRVRTTPAKVPRTEEPASDPFVSSPIAGTSHQASAAPNLRPSEAPLPCKPASRQPRDFDPISSSAPEPSRTPRPHTKRVINIDESDSDPDKSSDDDLPSIADLRNLKARDSTSFQRSRSDTYASKSKVTRRTTTASTTVSNTARSKQTAEEKERLKLEKQKAKEADKEAKKLATEQKKKVAALEKAKSAALAEVNKLKTDKKDSTQEMIVDLPSGLDEGLRMSAQTILEGLEPAPQHTVYESEIPNVVKFRRKVNSRYDETLAYWVPCPASIEDEGHILVVIDADEFVELAQNGLDGFAGRVEAAFPDAAKVYLLQGIATWKKKNRTLKNRQFASGVRGEAEASTSRRRRNPAKEPIDEDIVEDAMLQLQVEHAALIHHTTTSPDTASWISTFTQHISTVPYRHRRDADLRTANFCLESGQVKTGENPRDTYVKMLGEIGRVTDGIAYGVAEEFPSVGMLVRGLEREGGMERLGEVRKASNRNGAFSDMRIGAAMGRRFWHIFTGRDEHSTDV